MRRNMESGNHWTTDAETPDTRNMAILPMFFGIRAPLRARYMILDLELK